MANTTPTGLLASWYGSHCNDDWEHTNGVAISTIDNPGWRLRINIFETILSDVEFPSVKIDRSDHDWVRCKVEGGFFEGAGGAHNLDELIMCFLEWAAKFEGEFFPEFRDEFRNYIEFRGHKTNYKEFRGHNTGEIPGLTASGWDKEKSTDLIGYPHYNKLTDAYVFPPHTHGRGIPGGVRPATKDEIPER